MTSSKKLDATLKDIQLRLSVQYGSRLTHNEMAKLAGVGGRSFGEWIRGNTTPPGMVGLLRLLSLLDEGNLEQVLNNWRAEND